MPFSRSQTKYPSPGSKRYQQIQHDRFAHVNPYSLRPMVNLKPWMTAIEDQGKFNSCVAESIAGALEYLIKRYYGTDHGKEIDVSRFFIIWVGKMLEEETLNEQQNEGTWTPEAIYGLVKYGFCHEDLWPHTEYHRQFKPSKKAFREARKLTIIPLLIPPNLDSMRRCLNDNLPFLIAFDVLLLSRPDMIRINRGYNDENSTKQKSDLHAVLVVGYDDRTQLFLVRNSWGPSWGYEGYFYIPYKYMVNRNFMAHDSNGIWAIAEILPRKKNPLYRYKNPPKDPNNQFLTLATTEPIDLWYWYFRRFAVWAVESGQITGDDVNNTTLLYQMFIDDMEEHHPHKLRHFLDDDD